MEAFQTLILILDSTLRLSAPLLLACLAGLYSERAGVFDIGLEGKMLAAAFAAAAGAAFWGRHGLIEAAEHRLYRVNRGLVICSFPVLNG